MAQQTRCPACGAPLTIEEGHANVVSCGFCGTDLRVVMEDGQEHFQVLSQPGPQKEVLSNPVVRPQDSGSQDIGSQYSESPASLFGFGTQDTPSAARAQDGQPDNPYTSFGPVNPLDSTPVISDSIPSEQVPVYPGGAAAYPVNNTPPMPARNNATRWILIGVAAVAGLCVLCACLAGVLFMAQRQ